MKAIGSRLDRLEKLILPDTHAMEVLFLSPGQSAVGAVAGIPDAIHYLLVVNIHNPAALAIENEIGAIEEELLNHGLTRKEIRTLTQDT